MADITQHQRARVEDHPSLERDIQSNAILNRDRSAYLSRRKRIAKIREKDNQIASLTDQVKELSDLVRRLLGNK